MSKLNLTKEELTCLAAILQEEIYDRREVPPVLQDLVDKVDLLVSVYVYNEVQELPPFPRTNE